MMLITNSSFSVMNDNNDFVTFVLMVLFGTYRLLFWSFRIVPRERLEGFYREREMSYTDLLNIQTIDDAACVICG